MPFILDTTYTFISSTVQDFENVIYFGTTSNPLAGAETRIWEQTACVNSATSETYTVVFETDIVINQNAIPDFFYDTTLTQTLPSGKTDFYQVILHELGHCHLLEHINGPFIIMWWFAAPGPLTAPNRIVYLGAEDIQGGNYITMLSSSDLNPSICTLPGLWAPIKLIKPANCLGVSNDIEDISGLEQIAIYPNPVSGILTLGLELKQSADLSVSLTDLQGKTLQTYKFGKQPAGTVQYTINLSNIARGSYIVCILAGTSRYFARIIKN